MSERERLAELLEQVTADGTSAAISSDVIAARLIARGVRVSEEAPREPSVDVLVELQMGLRRAAELLCGTRRHSGMRPCDFCVGQVVEPYNPENLVARRPVDRVAPEPEGAP